MAPMRYRIGGRVEPGRVRGRIAWASSVNAAATRRAGGMSMASSYGAVALSVSMIEAHSSSEVLASLTFVAACEVGVRRIPVPTRGDRGRGALVSAVQPFLPRC